MASKLCFVVYCVLISFNFAKTAPRSKSKSPLETTYDQKQTGTFNVRLQLKDFNIIAIIGSDGELEDYDYNYDYSDLTVKPSSTTAKPAASTTASSSSSTPLKPSTSVSTTTSTTTTKAPPSTLKPKPETDEKLPNHIPVIVLEPHHPPGHPHHKPSNHVVLEELVFPVTASTSPKSTSTAKIEKVTEKNGFSETTKAPQLSGATIKVEEPKPLPEGEQIASTTNANGNERTKSSGDLFTNVKVITISNENDGDDDNDDNKQTSSVPLGEILHYRKCAVGYSRDKRGRCRKIRIPPSHLSLDIARLAGLAAMLRKPENGDNN